MSAYDDLVMKARDIINDTWGCGHSCCNELQVCHCHKGAKKIVDLTLDTISRQGREP